MAKNIKQYSVGKDNLYFFYRFVILPWEIEWANKKYLMSEGDLNKYCQDHKICIKAFDSADKLSMAISAQYKDVEREATGILWFVRTDTKPKDTLRHLRNCFSHGNYTKRTKNRAQYLILENVDNGRVKAKGFLPLTKLKGLVQAASGCEV